ncbi:MAG: hypothetical protein R2778_16635 [Saprospiraceae bacterium]
MYNYNDYWTWRRWRRWNRWNSWNSWAWGGYNYGHGYGWNSWGWSSYVTPRSILPQPLVVNDYTTVHTGCITDTIHYGGYWNSNHYYYNNGNNGHSGGGYTQQTYTGPRRGGSSVNPGYFPFE